jgi:UDP-N-acetylglucosamine transferase subunit ALG13
MARVVPDRISKTSTAGEKLLFTTLKDYLPEDYVVYYEPEINGKRPDFVIIGPTLGILVLEVKDYKRDTLVELNHEEWVIQYGDRDITTVKNPLKQARENVFHIADFLKKDKTLLRWEGEFKGKLKFPYGFGTVFTGLKQEHFVQDNLFHIIEPKFVLTRDQIDPHEEGFSKEKLLDKIHNMFTFPHKNVVYLSEKDINTIRYHLFPEIRISSELKDTDVYMDRWLISLNNLRVMDLHQENLAKALGDKHRLIRGVAGSGKTIVLASRVKMLFKQHPEWKILVLCYNIALSTRLKHLIQQRITEPDDLLDLIQNGGNDSYSHQVEVYNFHEWLYKKFGIRNDQEVSSYQGDLPQYDAILIDEGQDFEPEWLNLVSRCLNPDTQSFLLVEDRAQNIYKRKTSLLKETGLDFRGRSRILSINYRNTKQIIQFAWDFYRHHSELGNKLAQKTEDLIEIIPPQHTDREGPNPFVSKCANIEEEMHLVAKSIHKLYTKYGVPYSEMLILYRIKKDNRTPYVDIIRKVLEESKLPYCWISESNEKKRTFSMEEQSIKISTIESAKGLDFRAVFVVNVENMPFALAEDVEREVALIYIAMTRALEWLFLTFSGNSTFTKYLQAVAPAHKRPNKSAQVEQVPPCPKEDENKEQGNKNEDQKENDREAVQNVAEKTFDVVTFTKENHDSLLFTTLKNWRKKRAAANNTPAYTIMDDKSLLILATFVPHTKEEFLSLPYFKERRWEQYGAELLDILKHYEKKYDLFKYFPRYVSVKPAATQEPKKEEPSILNRFMKLFK